MSLGGGYPNFASSNGPRGGGYPNFASSNGPRTCLPINRFSFQQQGISKKQVDRPIHQGPVSKGQQNSSPVYVYDDTEVREKPQHAHYTNLFRVHICKDYLRGVCPHDEYSCFYAHGDHMRRRKPYLQHGRFNYIPTRCRYVLKEKYCAQGVHCRFAHSTEEMIYHPSKYKTKMCLYTLDNRGVCVAYGVHCAKAHGQHDLRSPVYEPPSHRAQMNFTFDDWHQFVCPVHLREQERNFYMYHYRTQRCKGFPWDCNCKGLKYHRPKDRRRGPIVAYAPVACSHIKSWRHADRSSIKSRNLQANHSQKDCTKAHTLLELMYHPQVYKTGLCEHFDENDPSKWTCVWKRGCAHAHGKAELRDKDEAVQLWHQHLRLNNLPIHGITNLAAGVASEKKASGLLSAEAPAFLVPNRSGAAPDPGVALPVTIPKISDGDVVASGTPSSIQRPDGSVVASRNQPSASLTATPRASVASPLFLSHPIFPPNSQVPSARSTARNNFTNNASVPSVLALSASAAAVMSPRPVVLDPPNAPATANQAAMASINPINLRSAPINPSNPRSATPITSITSMTPLAPIIPITPLAPITPVVSPPIIPAMTSPLSLPSRSSLATPIVPVSSTIWGGPKVPISVNLQAKGQTNKRTPSIDESDDDLDLSSLVLKVAEATISD